MGIANTAFYLFTFTCFVAYSRAASLPSYIKPCNRTEGNLNECIVRNGKYAIPRFINGDAKARVPKLNPMSIKELKVTQGTESFGMKLTMKDILLYGIENVQFTDARADLEKRYSEWDFLMPKIEMIGKYNVSGRILLLPVFGSGDSNVVVTDVKLVYKHAWEFVDKKGKTFMKIIKSDLDWSAGGAKFKFDNLFNGDRFLGSNMNQFINDNWQDVLKDIGPAIGKTFGNLIGNILTHISEQFPFDVYYPE